ncbi:hypothetical protein FHX37_0322 [Haloactinospora alba]|uniref:DUF4350 domain-containing protein n=1 Tax=Haloactinospora alba TaxID=405555 RepID=A0A543NF33_9ACTN|nr:DUF4350 domain-containing protein [Haloactinospora alba]TQN30444.1 hypothetical protein FHX37_0322 [Haloactinospora alba]
MTTSPAPSPGSETPTATSRSPGELWRRARGPVAFLGVLTLLSVVLSLGGQEYPTGPLEPEGPNAQGSRALVQVLQQRGNDVTVARSVGDAREAAHADSVLVVAGSQRLPDRHLERLSEASGDLLLPRPATTALEELAPEVERAGVTDVTSLDPGCEAPAAEAAGRADTGGTLYTPAEDTTGATGCYPDPGEDADDGYGLLRVDRENGGTTTLLGNPAPLTNERLARGGNAALALNLIGDRDTVWLLPDVPEDGEDAGLWQMLPVSLRMALIPLAVTLLALALWRGRRLGPLVSERLPVVVRAAETTEGRARLYASRHARDRAAAALRTGFLERVLPTLGLGPDATPETVLEALATRTGEDPQRVRALVYAPDEGTDTFTVDDRALVRLADQLDALARRVR